jgi:ABC-type polysaccharide/polyol phosphate export permease
VNTSYRAKLALSDVVEAAAKSPVWMTLGWQDIRQRYRRSVLGPFWITLATFVTIMAMGPLYGMLLKISAADFVPYLALGLIAWGFISSLILEGCGIFINSETIIKSARLPLSLHVLRVMYRNLLVFAHNAAAYLPIMVAFRLTPKWGWLMLAPGLLIVIASALPLMTVLGLFCTRFRDMQQLVASVVQLAFFMTPILWKPDVLHGRATIVEWNPLYIFVQLIRGPLYGSIPGLDTYICAIAITAVLYVIAIPLFARYRSRVAYWV